MELKSFDTILTGLCDEFDTLISPKTISRSNSNIIYLILKAIAKGMEVINNVCVSLRNKFDPASCDVEDLDSVAMLVGTKRLAGSGSGLLITATNNSGTAETLLAGTYTYELDADTVFEFELTEDSEVLPNSSRSYIAMSLEAGSFPVTEQTDITLKLNGSSFTTDLTFSCANNESLLGTKEESDIDFRKRILSDTTRQNTLVELQENLRNLPYLFDAKVYFNNTLNPVTTEDGIEVQPFYMIVFYSGEAKSEIAEIIARSSIYPTTQTADSVELSYESDVFEGGSYPVYIQPFFEEEYGVNISLHIDTTFISEQSAEATIRTALLTKMNQRVHKDYIKEAEIYNMISNMNIAGVEVLNVDLIQGGNEVPYVQVPMSRIPKLASVNFTEV